MTLTADPPYHILGYPPLNGDMLGNPLFEPSLSLEEKTRVFADWVSGTTSTQVLSTISSGAVLKLTHRRPFLP